MLNTNLKSWIEVPAGSDFSIHNIPFGIYSDKDVKHRACSAIGDLIIDLYEVAAKGLLNIDKAVFEQEYLNEFIALGKTTTNAVRNKLIELLTDNYSDLKNTTAVFKKQSAVQLLMPVRVGDYTDFYS